MKIGTLYNNLFPTKKNAIIITIVIHILLLIILNITSLSYTINTQNESIEVQVEMEEELPKEKENILISERQNNQKIETHIASSKDEKYDIKKLRNSLKSLKNINNTMDKNKQVDLFSPEATKRDIRADDTPANNSEELNTRKKIYTGKSTIYFSLKGRYQKYIPNPIYICPKGGIVVVNITVNQNGKVIDCQIDQNKTKVKDECLYQTALNYSKRTIFSISNRKSQKGYISYQFQ